MSIVETSAISFELAVPTSLLLILTSVGRLALAGACRCHRSVAPVKSLVGPLIRHPSHPTRERSVISWSSQPLPLGSLNELPARPCRPGRLDLTCITWLRTATYVPGASRSLSRSARADSFRVLLASRARQVRDASGV